MMLLHTPIYLLFLTLVLVLYWLLFPKNWRKFLLLIASYIFYITFDIRFLLVLFALTLTNFFGGMMIARETNTKRYVWLCVIVNLGALAYFKYMNFFLNNLFSLLDLLNIRGSFTALTLVLPIGISFYTFQGISYSIEIYRKRISPISNLMDFALYLAFFPKLIAGPLVKPAQFISQLNRIPEMLSRREIVLACQLLLVGLIKKVVIADNLTFFSDTAFQAALMAGRENGFLSPLFIQGFYLYAFHIYADFSGYTDLARGSAALFGFHLPENFRQPYFSQTVGDFWNRWHMSLTQWFREYLYFPLNRRLLRRTGRRFQFQIQSITTMTTMLLIGLWHGAAWTYVVWGLWHGLILIIENRLNFHATQRWQKILGCLVTFHLVGIGWIFFRSASVQVAVSFFRGLFSFNQMEWSSYYLPLILTSAFAVIIVDWVRAKMEEGFRFRYPWLAQSLTIGAFFLLFLLAIVNAAHGNNPRPYIYGIF